MKTLMNCTTTCDRVVNTLLKRSLSRINSETVFFLNERTVYGELLIDNEREKVMLGCKGLFEDKNVKKKKTKYRSVWGVRAL